MISGIPKISSTGIPRAVAIVWQSKYENRADAGLFLLIGGNRILLSLKIFKSTSSSKSNASVFIH